MNNCIFCKIISDKIPSYKVWENEEFLAILDIYPSVKGQTLVLPKKHIKSYIFDMHYDEYLKFMSATQTVAKFIDNKLGTKRTCMVMEGMEVNHAHIKLYPIYKIGNNTATETFDMSVYPGYLTTLHGKKASKKELSNVIDEINGISKK